ncbi:unnamed protein product, partial [Ectocarpus fasciculatus]
GRPREEEERHAATEQMPTQQQQQQQHTRDHAYAGRAGGSWSGVGGSGRIGQQSPPPSADPGRRRSGIGDGGSAPPSPLPELYRKRSRGDISSDGPATLVARGADRRGDLPAAVDDSQRQNRRFNRGVGARAGGGGGGGVASTDATSHKPTALKNGAGSAGGGRGSLSIEGRQTHENEMEIANEMERELRAESTSCGTAARRSEQSTGDGGGSENRQGSPNPSSVSPAAAAAATSVVSAVSAAEQQQHQQQQCQQQRLQQRPPQQGGGTAYRIGSHGPGGSSRADGGDTDGGGGRVVGVLSGRGAGALVRDGSAVASYPVYWREGCDRTASGDAACAKAYAAYKRDGEHTSIGAISSNNSSGSNRHSGGIGYASGAAGGPPAYLVHTKNANSDAAPSSSSTVRVNSAATRRRGGAPLAPPPGPGPGAPSAYNGDTVGYPHFKRRSPSVAAAAAASAAAARPSETCPPPSTGTRGRKGTGRPSAEGGSVSGYLGSLRAAATALRKPEGVGGRGGSAERVEKGRFVGRGVTRMEGEAFRPPGESASPLEMLGEGAIGSHQIVQATVPLGTRRIPLQILDDLSLVFVDMRAALLVRTATARPIMRELCLKTETFEEAVAFENTGEVVVCVPQFVKPRSALQEAGILDGDLITHINGARVSADRPEDLFWRLKPVKGVQLLDVTFLRATGESSAEGYPWHEALAFWKSGVRRHILDDAELGPSHQWMREAHDLRDRESIRNYHLCREFTMQEQEQDAMEGAITKPVYPGRGGTTGRVSPVAKGDSNNNSRSIGSNHKQNNHRGNHDAGIDNSKGSSTSNNHSGKHLGRDANGAAASGRRRGVFVMSSSNGSSKGGPQRYPGASPPPDAGVDGPGVQQLQHHHHHHQGRATSAGGLETSGGAVTAQASRPPVAPANQGPGTSTSKASVDSGVVGGGRVGAGAPAAAGTGEGSVCTSEGGGSAKRKASPSWDGGRERGGNDGGGKTAVSTATTTAAAAAAALVVARTAAATPTTMAPSSPSIVGFTRQSDAGGAAAGGSACFPMRSTSVIGTTVQQQQQQVQMQMHMQMQQVQQMQQQQRQQQYPIGAAGLTGVCGGGVGMAPGQYPKNDCPGQNNFLGGGIGQPFMSPFSSFARMGGGLASAGPTAVWGPGNGAITGVGRPGGGGGAGASRTGMMMTPQQPHKHLQPQTEYHAPQPGLVPARGGGGGGGIVVGSAPGLWIRQPATGRTIYGGPWRPRTVIS